MTREEATRIIKECKEKGFKHTFYTLNEYYTALDMAIKALEQEPFIKKPCVSEKVCEHDKQMVLDKIRAEIMSKDGLEETLEIIDKYKDKAKTQ